jgi:hypothetical protein
MEVALLHIEADAPEGLHAITVGLDEIAEVKRCGHGKSGYQGAKADGQD